MLTELLGVKKYADHSVTDLIDILFDGHGKLRAIGAGANGVAVTNGTIVYKLWVHDPPFEAWVEFCRANSSNPALPKYFSKIKSMPIFFKTSDKVRAKAGNRLKYVQMEKLELYDAIPYWTIFEHDPARAALKEAGSRFNGENIITAVSIGDLTDQFTNNDYANLEIVMKAHARHHQINFDFMRYRSQISHELVKAIELITEIYKVAKKTGGNLDFHDDNFAKRGKQIVFLDPISSDRAVQFNADELGLGS